MEKKSNVKEMKMHRESYFMYEKTKKETEERMREAMNADGSKRWTEDDIAEKLKLLQSMQDEVKEKFLFVGGNPDDLISPSSKTDEASKKLTAKKPVTKKQVTDKPKITLVKKKKEEDVNEEDVTEEIVEDVTSKRKPITKVKKSDTPVKHSTSEYKEVSVVPANWNAMSFSDSFDVIPLPSKGECYENHMATIAVSYLTANDENMIVSPNLYRDGLILDYLLKAKIKNNSIDPDDLLEGDRDAIILWLRATGYGTQYPITVTDNKTGVEFDTVIDLTQIKHKPFVLEGDENGHFDFTLPVSKDEIKFRFLTHGDIKQIEEIEVEEQANVKRERLINIVKDLGNYLENTTELTKDEKTKLFEAKRNINKWAEKIKVDNEMGYTHKLTNQLELAIVSINGDDDREYIADYVANMNVRDALAIRRYITENEPGLDYTVTVERPESLGGGSMPVFLSLDEYVFLNIA